MEDDILGVVQPMTQWANRPPSEAMKETNEQLEGRINAVRAQIGLIKEDGLDHAFSAFAHVVNPMELVPDVAQPVLPEGQRVISRAYYKMLEIADTFELAHSKENPVAALLCEAPGGFAQYLSHCKPAWKMACISLLPDSLTKHHAPVITMHESQKEILFRGGDGTGNLLKMDNITGFCDFVDQVSGGTMADLCTADGGMEVDDRNAQEAASMNLVVAQVLSAMSVLKQGGSFVLKLFDTFTETTEVLLYLLTMLFEDTSLYKPYTSRVCNSEKYFVGKGYIGLGSDALLAGKHSISDVIEILETFVRGNPTVLDDFVTVPFTFKLNLRHYNTRFVNMQIGYLTTALQLSRHLKEKNKTSKQDLDHLIKVFKTDKMARDKASAFCLSVGIPVKENA